MLPATRSGSVRLTEIAIMPFGIGQAAVGGGDRVAELAAMICCPEKIGTEAIVPFSAVVEDS